MTDATDFTAIPIVRKQRTPSVPLPAPILLTAPILISDCVSPLAGETLLGLIWKRLDAPDEKRPGGSPGRCTR